MLLLSMSDMLNRDGVADVSPCDGRPRFSSTVPENAIVALANITPLFFITTVIRTSRPAWGLCRLSDPPAERLGDSHFTVG